MYSSSPALRVIPNAELHCSRRKEEEKVSLTFLWSFKELHELGRENGMSPKPLLELVKKTLMGPEIFTKYTLLKQRKVSLNRESKHNCFVLTFLRLECLAVNNGCSSFHEILCFHLACRTAPHQTVFCLESVASPVTLNSISLPKDY